MYFSRQFLSYFCKVPRSRCRKQAYSGISHYQNSDSVPLKSVPSAYIRVKDKNSNGIASGLNLPPNDEFDIDITQIFSRKITKATKNAGYKWMPVNQVFDYLPRKSDKTKQVNFTIAIYICREYLRNKRNLSPPDVINLIEKHVLPVRPGRKDPRKVKPQASVSFLYRVA